MASTRLLAASPASRLDWRGIGVFLGLTFGLTYAAEGLAIASGMRFTTAANSLSGLLKGSAFGLASRCATA